MNGTITAIKRFEIHDGPGIRTTVFLKGCPLRCRWCHNPENISGKPELLLHREKCIQCGLCAAVCPNHRITDGIHSFDRGLCTGCGKCAAVCPAEALILSGESIAPEELLPQLLEDRMFFESSGGGITVSGGEPLMQPEFTAELLRLIKKEGIHTAVDTCCFASRTSLEQVMPWADLFLVDIKAIDTETHLRCTGVPNRQILENIRFLDRSGKAMEIRVPLIPGYNDHEMDAIAGFIASLSNPPRVKLLSYHDLGISKAIALDLIPEQIEVPSDSLYQSIAKLFISKELTLAK